MSAQVLVTFALGAVALGYLLLRILRRRGSGNCCGDRECPAARELVRKMGLKSR